MRSHNMLETNFNARYVLRFGHDIDGKLHMWLNLRTIGLEPRLTLHSLFLRARAS